MTLRSKALIIIGATLAGLLGVLYLVSRMVLLGSFAKLEEQDTRRNVDRVLSALADDLATLDHNCKDSATWDKSYAFIESGNPEFIRSDIGYGPFSNLAQRRLNLLLYIDASGRIVFGEGFDLKAQKEEPIPKGLRKHLLTNGTLLRHTTPESGVAGIVLIAEGPMLVASRPILTTQGQGPIRGSLLMGRYLDLAEVERLSQKTHLSLSVLRFEDSQTGRQFSSLLNREAVVVQPLNDDSVTGYALVRDIGGEPALVLRITMPREIYTRGRASVLYFISSLLAAGVVFGLLTVLLLEKAVWSRMAKLRSSVLAIGQTGNLSGRVPVVELTHLQGLPVLVVDDNATNRCILEEMLLRWRMTPTLAASGRAALAELEGAKEKGKPFPLVLTDAQMPEMDGFALAERIKQNPELAGATILMLTSVGHRGDAARCRELGIAAYLTKPIGQSELLDAILRVLGPEVDKASPPSLVTRHMLRQGRRSLKILLVEDNPVNRALAFRLLQRRGSFVAVAGDGREALAALEKQIFDLVLMDVQMPEMDGLEATAAIREREKRTGTHLPIIAMTAAAMKGDRERCLEAGMDGYISKPIRAEELFEVIESLLTAPEVIPAASNPTSTSTRPVLCKDS
jgi:CheY-like chemotaxis protein